MSQIARLIREIDQLKAQLAAATSTPQLAHSAIEGGSINSYDHDGNLRLRIGDQGDGTQTVTVVDGPVPPAPSAPVVAVDGPVLTVSWDGQLADPSAGLPADFARIHIHLSQTPDMSSAPVRASIEARAGASTVTAVETAGTWWVALAVEAQSGKRSPLSAPVEAVVSLVNLDGALEAVRESADGKNRNYYNPVEPSPDDDLAEGDLWFDTSEDEDGLTRYTPHRWDGQQWVSLEDERTQAIQDAQREFEQSTSQALSDVQQAASGAQSAADAAQETANTARSEATSKAQAAQQAAEAHAEAVAEAERLAAIAAASDDATAKAAAAEAAAIAAAALDAKTKADAAQAAAEAKAQAAQDAADAAMDRANDAHSAAGNAADAADAAMQAATHNAKNLWSTSDPSGTAPQGTIWFKIDPATKNVVGQWQQTGGSATAFGSNWEKRSLTDALFDNIDAGKIGTGYLDVAKLIRAGAIQADKLMIESGANLFPDQAIAQATGFGSWSVVDGGLERTGTGAQSGSYWTQWSFEAVPGERIHGSFTQEADTPGNTSMYISWQMTPGGAWVSPHLVSQVSGAGDASGSTSVPSGALRGRIGLYVEGNVPSGVQKRVTGIRVRRMTGSTLIADGAITTSKIAAGAITAESGVIGSLDLGKATVGELDGARIKFGSASGEILKLDALDGKVITGTVVQTARSGARVVLGEDGLSVYDAADDWRVRLTPDGSMFKGDMEAESLVATGPAELRHAGNSLAPAAELALAAGVGDPTGPPTVQPFWPSIDFDLPWTPAGQIEFTGLAFDGTAFWTSVREWTEGGKAVNRHERLRIDPVTGQVTKAVTGVRLLSEPFGVARVGDRLYWLTEGERDYQIVVEVTDLTGNYVTMWEYLEAGWSSSNPLGYRPGIGATFNNNLIIAHCTDAGSLIWRTYTTTGELQSTVDCKDSTSSDIAGAYLGAADWPGSTNISVLKGINRSFETFDQQGRWQPSLGWRTGEGQNESGLCFANGAFHSIVKAAQPGGRGRITRYAGAGMGGEDWWAAYRWAGDTNDDGTADHLSRISPARGFAWPARSQLKVLGAQLPDGVSSIAPVLAKSTTRPARERFRTPAWTSTPGRPEAVYESLPKGWDQTAPPVDANSFPDASPAVVRSANRNIELRGDGSARLGPLLFDKAGRMSGIPAIAAGQAIMRNQSPGETSTMTVTLPAGKFSTPPSVVVTPTTSVPYTVVRGVSAGNVTTTSFTLYVNRTSSTNTSVSWIAVEGA